MPFPYARYQTLDTPLTFYYPEGQQELARKTWELIKDANKSLESLLDLPVPALQILLVADEDWQFAPHAEDEGGDESLLRLPFATDVTDPPTLVIPVKLDRIVGNATLTKRAFLIFHELAHAFLESDPRPWPLESPLWADEWQMQFAALWLTQRLFGLRDIAQTDLHKKYAQIFVPEADGKTPVTVRGFDWYEETTPQEYLAYTLLLERFAADLLARFDATILPRFLVFYREDQKLLSDDVTNMLAAALGPAGASWLESLNYF
jgi:hypothetical protein